MGLKFSQLEEGKEYRICTIFDDPSLYREEIYELRIRLSQKRVYIIKNGLLLEESGNSPRITFHIVQFMRFEEVVDYVSFSEAMEHIMNGGTTRCESNGITYTLCNDFVATLLGHTLSLTKSKYESKWVKL